MLKFLQLTCLTSLLLAGGSGVALYAQSSQDANASDATVQVDGMPVTGVVRDAVTGEGLSGINIAVEGFSAAITEEDGSFEIKVPNLQVLLAISGQEFQSKVHPLRGMSSNIDIILHEANYSPIYELATMPGGDKLEYINNRAASVVNFEEGQWGNPINESTGDYLQGRVAGLNTVRKSGSPGVGAYMTIRGFNSLYGTNQPLIVVDGMIYDDQDYGSGILQNNISSPLANIDVKDIEDVTVLKDGSALYGTKGANGVIIITTTRPTELTTKIDFIMQSGFNNTPDEMPVLGASQFRTYMSQMISTQGLTQTQVAARPFMNDMPGSPNYAVYNNSTNWQDQVFQSSTNQNYFMKIRGGDDIAKYGLSVGYMSSGDIIEDTETNRYSTRLNAALRLTDKLMVNANLSFINNQQEQRDQGLAFKTNPLYLALTKAPFLNTNAINETGQVSPNLADTDIFDVGNPRAIIENGIGTNKNYRFFGNLKFNYTFNENWDLNTILGLTYNKERETFFIPDLGVADVQLPIAIATNRSGSEVQQLNSLYTDTYLHHSKIFTNQDKLDIRVGFRSQSNDSESDLGLGYNSATDDFVSVGAGSNLLRQVGGALGEWNWLNGYTNLDYSIANKYFFTGNLAVDSSSRFGDGEDGQEQYAVLGSAAAAWLLSSENFMSGIKAIDYLKLRAAYTLTGNEDIGNYTAQKFYISQNLLGIQGLVTGNIGNPDLRWETIQKLNIGADLGLFSERLNASIDVFANQTDDMIIYENAPNTSGNDFVVSNSGSMRTVGAELALHSRVINRQDISWDLNLNVATYSNEVQSLPDGRIVTQFGGATYVTAEGFDANMFYGLESNGVYATTAEAQAEGLSRKLPNGELVPFGGGDMRFTDLNGDNIIDDADRLIIGNPNPDFTGSFASHFRYNRFSLNAFFTFSVGNELYNAVRYNLEKMSGYENQSVAVANRWRAEGQQTTMPRAVWGDPMGNSEFSSRWIEDGSYLRLKTVVMSYDIPVKDLNYIKSVTLYTSANNLITFTDYLGFDPEFSATNSIFGQGVDVGLIPQFTTVQLGLRLGL